MCKDQLVDIYNFLKEASVFESEPHLDTASKLNHMYERGWLYASYLANKVIATAGAFRIKKWDTSLLTDLPNKEEGNILYIPFFACNTNNITTPLKLLKQYLREHPLIHEVIYYKKAWVVDQDCLKSFSRKKIIESPVKKESPSIFRPHISIHPPELTTVSSTDDLWKPVQVA
ncbi:MAG: hypothetical protein WCT36_05975 [Candidatus Gracilibacteria bacterium]